MNSKEFIRFLQTRLPDRFPEAAYFHFFSRPSLQCSPDQLLRIEMPGELSSPVFSLSALYRRYAQGEPLSRIVHYVEEEYAAYERNTLFREQLPSPEEATGLIVFRLRRGDTGDGLAARGFFGMCVTYEINLPDAAPVALTPDGASHLGLSEEDLFRLAQANSDRLRPATLRHLTDVLSKLQSGRDGSEAPDLLPDPAAGPSPAVPCADGPQLFLLSNHMGPFGASVILYPGLCERLSERLGSFYLLPCSIHEWILVPSAGEENWAELSEIVRDVNALILTPEDYLSDTILFCGADGSLRPAGS
ncbi:MAG: hypothetical protein ILP12_07960 [Lachnospiraceae bacterium]|nr:hypothetical protein [Lachnospiraceae bacterium]